MDISEIVKRHRKKHNLTLRELSSITGISHSQLGKIEQGKSKPSNQTILRILDFYDEELTKKEIEELIGDEELVREKNELLRYEVLTRDNFTCQLCGNVAPDVPIEVDEIIPAESEKEVSIDGWITLCKKCKRARRILNEKKGIENDFLYNKRRI